LIDKFIEISQHAREQMAERGAKEKEVLVAIREGEAKPTRSGRVVYRKNFQFNGIWRGKSYTIKQVAPVVVEESEKLVVVTVYTFYF